MDRIKKVLEVLKRHDLAALIIDNPIDLYYLTGQHLSLGRLVVSHEAQLLYVDGRYFEGCKKNASVSVQLTSGYGKESFFRKNWQYEGKRIGFDAQYTTYETFLAFKQLSEQLVALKSPITQIREIKQPDEIHHLREAATLGSKGMDHVLTLLKEGVTEEELALELELFWRKAGGERLAFDSHIAFGVNTSEPHYQPSNYPLKQGEVVMIDIGVVLKHYHSDMTRVVCLGSAPPELSKIYQIVFEAKRKALALCRPGRLIKEIDQAARDWITQQGYGDKFPHGLGHGVGLEIHEWPIVNGTTDRPLAVGMVITIEPGIYLPKTGGVRLEDTILITPEGYENLTKRPISPSIPNL